MLGEDWECAATTADDGARFYAQCSPRCAVFPSHCSSERRTPSRVSSPSAAPARQIRKRFTGS